LLQVQEQKREPEAPCIEDDSYWGTCNVFKSEV
jgi:hypothetical protein